MRKLKSETTRDIVDITTGEVIRTTTEKVFNIKVENQDEFFMVYTSFMKEYLQIKRSDDLRIMSKFCMMGEYNSGKVVLSQKTREDILKELKMSKSSLSRSIKRLLDMNLISGEKGTYIINPVIFFKGSNSTRNKILKEKGITLKINFTQGDDEKEENENEV
jgi:hypothetical protein